MSHFAELLQPRLPAGITIPDELEQAWQWMENQGHGLTNEHGYFLTPYPGDRQLGIVFDTSASLEGWFDEGARGADRLIPLAEAAGDGSTAALWLDDSGQLRVVELGAGGNAFILAQTAVDFLRLIAVGYAELSVWELGTKPDPESVAAVAAFRDWVQANFAVTVPEQWQVDEPDEFTAWVEAQREDV